MNTVEYKDWMVSGMKSNREKTKAMSISAGLMCGKAYGGLL
jgi:hypothetical protein